jgi:hypothetical protein
MQIRQANHGYAAWCRGDDVGTNAADDPAGFRMANRANHQMIDMVGLDEFGDGLCRIRRFQYVKCQLALRHVKLMAPVFELDQRLDMQIVAFLIDIHVHADARRSHYGNAGKAPALCAVEKPLNLGSLQLDQRRVCRVDVNGNSDEGSFYQLVANRGPSPFANICRAEPAFGPVNQAVSFIVPALVLNLRLQTKRGFSRFSIID